MGSSVVFPDGTILVSSALTPRQIEAIFQPLAAQMLGFDPVGNPDSAYFAVRIGWQTEGQPAWEVTDNVCVLTAFLENDPFARVRDNLYEMTGSPADVLTDEMGFTQVWKMHFSFYGPSSANWARQMMSAMTLDWVHDALAAVKIYRIPASPRPMYAPELFPDPGGVWYERTDVEVYFNEQVSESLAPVTPAEEVVVTVDTDAGDSRTFTIAASDTTAIGPDITWDSLTGLPWSLYDGTRWQ